MNIRVTSGRERFARDQMREHMQRLEKQRERREHEKQHEFEERIGPGVEFVQDKLTGRYGTRGEKFTIEDHYRHAGG